MPEALNLDDIGVEDRIAIAGSIDHPGLLRYIILKNAAEQARKDGKIPKALVYELACNQVYNFLPEELKW